MKRIINRFFLPPRRMKQLTISSWCLVFPTIQQKIEFQDVLLNKLKVVHESANAMTKTLLLKSCSWYFQNCSGYFCCCCMSLLKTENENSLKSNVTLLRDAAAYLQVPWPFSILSLWKNKEELCNTSTANLSKTEQSKGFITPTSRAQEAAPRDTRGRQHLPNTINSWKRRKGHWRSQTNTFGETHLGPATAFPQYWQLAGLHCGVSLIPWGSLDCCSLPDLQLLTAKGLFSADPFLHTVLRQRQHSGGKSLCPAWKGSLVFIENLT